MESVTIGSLSLFIVPPEVTSAERTVHAWPGGRADLTCIVRAEPRATVSKHREILSQVARVSLPIYLSTGSSSGMTFFIAEEIG